MATYTLLQQCCLQNYRLLTHFSTIHCCVSISLVHLGKLHLVELCPMLLCPQIYPPIQQEQLDYQHYYRALVHVVGYIHYVQLFHFHFPYIRLPLGGSEVAPPPGPGQSFRTCPIFPQPEQGLGGLGLNCR